LGRNDGDSPKLQDCVNKAIERKTTPTEHYLLENLLLAEYWSDGSQSQTLKLSEELGQEQFQ